MHYCGVVPVSSLLQLAMLEEVRAPEPPIRLAATFFEPGLALQVAAELRALREVVVAVAAPAAAGRACDEILRGKGVPPAPLHPEAARLFDELAGLGLFSPLAGDGGGHEVEPLDTPAAGTGLEGAVPEGAFREAPVFETNVEAVFCALQGHRLPARRHPLGVRLRVEELLRHHVVDPGDLWNRRIEEVEAAGAALCAHRYAVGPAHWLGRIEEGVLVLPGSSVPEEFAREGVVPPVPRLQLPPLE